MPSVKPTPPRVDCKQQATADISPAPRADQWLSVEETNAAKVVRLSEAAAKWIVTALGIATQERKLRKIEHQCLDDLAEKKIIQQ